VLRARELADSKIKVMPAMRWQVFQRDNWKCVSCGRTPIRDDVTLHVDHINPRSKGGKDLLENYQTLCSVCNLGKSNKDNTNLRILHL
jgi:5-methylcytosine-specific restriction endonuclease McrA